MQLRLTMCPAAKIFAGVLALGVLVPALLCASTAGAIHVPSGRIYIISGPQSANALLKNALQACRQKEGSTAVCAAMENYSTGACDTKYGAGNHSVTAGGFQFSGDVNGYTGHLYCGKSETESDQGFQKNCTSAAGCVIWQHYTDQYNP